MIGIGQIIIQAFGALWRRRWTVLLATVAWLAVDGLLLGQVRVCGFSPGNAWAVELGDWFRVVLYVAERELPSNVVRAVFVVIILRALLKPSSDSAKGPLRGFIVPMTLVALFEVAWTAIRWPLEKGGLLTNPFDRQTALVVFQWADEAVFVGYTLAMSKLCFVYPSAVLGLGLRLEQSWCETKGLALRLFLIFLATAVPFAMLYDVLTDMIREYVTATGSYEFWRVYKAVAQSARDVPQDVLVLAVIAVAYVAATGIQSDAIPGSQPDSETTRRDI